MKGKFKFLAVALTFVIAIYGFVAIATNAIQTVQAMTSHIDFELSATYTKNYDTNDDSINDALLVDDNQQGLQVTVVYTIVHNDGINNIVMIPTFDANVFSISSITVNEDLLGAATITGNEVDSEVTKIALESETTYTGKDETLVTIVYNVNTSAANTELTSYQFGLYLGDEQNYNDTSKAHVFLTGENNGEQEEVEIRFTATSVSILKYLDAEIAIGYNDADPEEYKYVFVYTGSTPTSSEIADDAEFNTTSAGTIEYKYNGTATPVIKWYTYGGEDLETGDPIYDECEAPVIAGIYYVGISAPADGVYKASPTVYRRVNILTRSIQIVIDNKSSEYGAAIVPLTFSYGAGSLSSEEEALITLSTTATSSSNAGTYSITGTVSEQAAGRFNIMITDGIYTITAKSITITAQDQSAEYTGSEPTVDQTRYTVTGATITSGVVIVKAPGVNVGEYTLTPSYNNPNYAVNAVTGKFYITSKNVSTEYILSFFSGDSVVYDAAEHNLLIVSGSIPSWLANAYTVSNNLKTNVGTYAIGLNFNFDQTTANNYTNGTTSLNLAVEYGYITPKAITITADNKSSAYGSAPATLTPTTAGIGGEIAVSFSVLDNETPITLSSTTPVGTYTIVPNAANGNYTITLVNGTYTVTMGQATITSITAQDVYYNRPLNYEVLGVSIPGIANPVEGTDYTITVTLDTTQEHGDVVNGVRPYGTYTITATVAGTSAYNGTTSSTTFHINQIALKAPTNVTYTAYDTVTWNEITTDEGDLALVEGTTIIYSRGVNNEYTALDSGMFTVYFHAQNNDNYTSATLALKPVIEARFVDYHTDHAKDDIDPENMPSSIYMFVGEYVPGIVLPDTNPTLPGYTFNGWSVYSEEEIGEDIYDSTLTRVYKTNWTIKTLTMTLKFTETSETLGEDMFTVNVEYKEAIAWTNIPQPTKVSTNPGITYVYNNTVKVSGTETTYTGAYNTSSLALQGIVATENTTFIALYDVTYNTFTITYYVSVDSADYDELLEYEATVTYGDTINYASLPNIIWFRVDSWYTNTDRTIVAPATMPAHDIDVYGAYVFDIGTGDINGDGYVNANDITLYRQWIVGGYEMTALTSNEDIFDAVNAELETQTETKYFIYRVADINGDSSKDIRDISITRMAIVGGYTWDNENGYNVTGNEIIRNVNTNTLSSIDSAIRAGKKVTLTGDVTEAEGIINISTTKHVNIDLGGHTLTLKSFSVVSTRRTNITITNGTIITEEGITIASPYGNVVITDVTGYDANGIVNLAAANHSLHLNGVVAFRHGDTTESVPAQVNVEKDTHIVVEPEAEVIVEKIIVTEDFVPAVAETAIISIDNFSVVTEEIVVVGNVTMNDNEIDTLEELIEIATKGGNYVLAEDLTYTGQVGFTVSTTLDLNGHTLRSTNDVALVAVNGATLTIKGNGNVMAQEACVMAFDASEVVINGGTYTAVDNFIFGTNGTRNRGKNTLTINNGTFNGGIVTNGYVACGVYVANDDLVYINGGTFNITNGVGVLARSGNTTIGEDVVFNVTGNGTLGKVGDAKVTVPAGEVIVLDRAAGYPGGLPTLTNLTENSVYINGVIANVNDLVYAAQNGGVYTVTADVTYTGQVGFTKDTTIKLNNHTLRSTNDVALSALNGATLTINGNGNVIAQEACVMAFDASEVVINGGTYTAIDNFVFGTNGTNGRGGNTIIINAGTFNGGIVTNGYVACGVYVANNDTVTINGGTFNITNGVGVLARSGNTTIGANVTMNVTGNSTLGKVGDSRVVIPSGEELVIDYLANYPGGNPTLTNNSSYSVHTISND